MAGWGLALAAAVPEREGARRGGAPLSWLAGIGTAVLASLQGAGGMLSFIGEAVLAFSDRRRRGCEDPRSGAEGRNIAGGP